MYVHVVFICGIHVQCTWLHVCMCTCMHTYMYMYVHVYICRLLCTSTCMYVCMNRGMYILCTCVYYVYIMMLYMQYIYIHVQVLLSPLLGSSPLTLAILKQASWLKVMLFNASSRAARRMACNILYSLCNGETRQRQILDLLSW